MYILIAIGLLSQIVFFYKNFFYLIFIDWMMDILDEIY